MKKVVCINDKNLFPGAKIVEGVEYKVSQEFINNWGQKTYILEGIINSGVTPKGLRWYGYDAIRFIDPLNKEIIEKEIAFNLN